MRVPTMLLALLAAGCAGSNQIPEPVAQFRAALTPPNGKLFPPLSARTTESTEISWIVETDWSWQQYVEWAPQRLGADFVTEVKTSTEITLKSSSGIRDQRIRIRSLTEGDAAHFRVTVMTHTQSK